MNNVSREGIPVFMEACETAVDNEDTCIMLLEKGADPNSKQQVCLLNKKFNISAL